MIYLICMILFNLLIAYLWAANDVRLYKRNQPVRYWKKWVFLGLLFIIEPGALIHWVYDWYFIGFGFVFFSSIHWISFDLFYNHFRFGGENPFYVGSTSRLDKLTGGPFLNIILKLIYLSIGLVFWWPLYYNVYLPKYGY